MEKEIRRKIEVDKLTCLKKDYRIKKLTDYQYRVNDVIDIFPTNQKFHNIVTNKRGQYFDLKRALEFEISEINIAKEHKIPVVVPNELTKKDAKHLNLLLGGLLLFCVIILTIMIIYGNKCM